MSPYKKILRNLASFKITITCLTALFGLTIIGTLAQVNLGIYYATQKYFTSFWIYTAISPSLKFPIFPGGTTIGLIMIINLTAAMLTKFKFTRKKIGLWLSHLGLILLLAGAGLTAFMATESQMSIEEGQSSNYAVDNREVELAIIDASSPSEDILISIPESRLKTQAPISLPELNLDLIIKDYYNNSKLLPTTSPKATQGIGTKITPTAIPIVTHDDYRNITSIFIEFKDHGTYLFSTGIDALQELKTPEKTYLITLRYKRHYNDYFIKLIDFKRDLYPGTQIPYNFSSDITVIQNSFQDPSQKTESFESKIYMNHPLRYRGKTYYQASYLADEKTSIFQVVENPSWTIPYISCIMISLGLLIHFLVLLTTHLKKTSNPRHRPSRPEKKLKPIFIILTLITLALLPALKPLPNNLSQLAQLPVQEGGRIKPLDSVARTTLTLISGKQKTPDKRPPIAWLLDVITDPEKTDKEEIFLIENPQLFAHIDEKYNKQKYRVSHNFLKDHQANILKVAEVAEEKERPQRNPIEKEFIALKNKMALYLQVKNTIAPENTHDFPAEINDFKTIIPKAVMALNTPASTRNEFQDPNLIKLNRYFKRYQALESLAYFDPIPTNKGFISTGEAILQKLDPKSPKNPVLDTYIQIQKHPNTTLTSLTEFLNSQYPNQVKKAKFEYLFNKANPFHSATLLYITAILLILISWLTKPKKLQFIALKTVEAGIIIHSIGLVARMLIGGRPPVTNLYSSAVFVGWGAILIALFLERRYKNSIGTLVSGIIGAITLIIAHHLSLAGDTLEMMQAVLDSNFWLATHVIIITLGYSTIFLAGLLAHIYVLKAFLTKSMTKEKEKNYTSMIYGVLCFALLLSFVGTVLGGIWADQSWGRFWGWDPKENGAILIVLWVAIILHARIAGYIKTKGLMAMSIIGNVICSFSWFGVNLLGIGLHSYGFMEKGFFWLSIFWASQLVFLTITLLPKKFYNSNHL